MTSDACTKMVADAEANAEADRQFEELIGVRNTLEGLIHATKKTLEEAGDKAEESEKSAIEAAIKEAEEAVKEDDKAAMETATTKLTEASSSLTQKLYAEQAATAQEGQTQTPDNESSPKDEGVVDAEFEEVKDDK